MSGAEMIGEQSLRTCPFCKSPNVYIWECEDTSAGCSTFWVECECGARGSISEYKEGAAQYWNAADNGEFPR